MSANLKNIKLGFTNNDPLEGVEDVIPVEDENVKPPLGTNSRASSIGSEPRTPGPPSAFNLRTAPALPLPKPVPRKAVAATPALPLPKPVVHRTPASIRWAFARIASEAGIGTRNPNYDAFSKDPLTTLYNTYLEYGEDDTLEAIKQRVAKLGYTHPIVQALQELVEGLWEQQAQQYEKTMYKRLEKLISASGGSFSGYGGKRRTRKQKRKIRKSRKHRHSRK